MKSLGFGMRGFCGFGWRVKSWLQLKIPALCEGKDATFPPLNLFQAIHREYWYLFCVAHGYQAYYERLYVRLDDSCN